MANVIVLNQLQLTYELEDNFEINSLKTKNYIDRLRVIDKLPFNKGIIYFSDDVWNFSQYTSLNIPKDSLKFKFNLCPDEFKDDIKSYVLIKILDNNNKIQSIHRYFVEIDRFFRFVVNENIFSVYEITFSKITKYINEKEALSDKSMKLLKGGILSFYEFYSINYKNILTTDIRGELDQRGNGESEENKYDDIPSKYFDNLMEHLLWVIDCEEEKLGVRAVACILLILSQTGLRIGELLQLEIDSLKSDTLYNGKKAYYLLYKTWKRENGNNVCTIERTYINDLSQKGFDTLLELHRNNREKKETNFLYVADRAKILPVQCQSFNKSMLSFFSYYGYKLDAIDSGERYPELQTTQIHDKYYMDLHPNAKTLTYPVTPQFRVHVCSVLYHGGVPLDYIRKFMGHLTSQMDGYYVRPKENQVQEDIEFSKSVLKDVVSGELNLLGPNANEFSERLKNFLKENKLNVADNIDEVVENLLKTIPVRNKTGGVCIKSSPLRECSKDSMTNELYCAYGVCPNIFHFFYMAEVSYRQGKELVSTITLNIKRGHKKQVQKELNMLKTVTTQKVIPELDELKKELDKNGVQQVLFKYPDLYEIIKNFDEIYKEVQTWITLKQPLLEN